MQSLFFGDPTIFLARIVAFLTAIPFHEAAHAYVSSKLGDPTAKNLGRLTLNPIKHIDPWGFVAMMTIGIGWAKPVPVDPRYYKDRKVGMALTAAAGPLSNLLLGYILYILYKIAYYVLMVTAGGYTAHTVSQFILILSYINVNLAFFNLLPIPPFDGSKIFGLVLPNRLYFKMQEYERYVMIGVLVLLFIFPRVTGYDPVGSLLSFLNTFVMRGYEWGTGFVDIICVWLLR